MGVGLKPKFTANDIRKIMFEKAERVRAAVLLALKKCGDTFVNNARNNHTYKDQTGNLTSSIGYIILIDGVIIEENFKKIIDGDEGYQKGKAFALDAMSRFSSGWVLIGVAGMEYAAAVESKNRDVISSSSDIAADELKKALFRISKKLR